MLTFTKILSKSQQLIIKQSLCGLKFVNRFNFSSLKHSQPIYVDFQATTPLDFRVCDAMLPYFQDQFGNPHSKSHQYGWKTHAAVENARAQIASLINADTKDIIFTSGATESNNLALQGMSKFYKRRKNHIITFNTEHKCVLETFNYLETQGMETTVLPVQKDGLIDLNLLKDTIRRTTLCVSTLFLNNEIGVIQPIKEIGQICREKRCFFHVDGAQAIGKTPIDVEDMNIDIMGLTAHKCYGPKGIGALYIRRIRPRIRVSPMIHGGGQERSLRSGTLSPALCVGFGSAAQVCSEEMKHDLKHIRKLQQKMIKFFEKEVKDVRFNGSLTSRYPGNLNVSFKNCNCNLLVPKLSNLALSTGAACLVGEQAKISYVLAALNVKASEQETHIRFGLGRFTTEEEIDYALNLIKTKVNEVRKEQEV